MGVAHQSGGTMNAAPGKGATYDSARPSILISGLEMTHPAVTAEALRWSTGTRGPAVPAPDMDGADLTAYIEQALAVGAQAISVAGGTQDTFNLEQLVADVGARTSQSTDTAILTTQKVVADAANAVSLASSKARQELVEASETARKAFGTSVSTAQQDLRAQVSQLLGGDDPELMARLEALLTKFGAGLTTRADEHSATLYEKATRALDPEDPTSPFAKQMTQMGAQYKELASMMQAELKGVGAKMSELTTAVQVQKAAAGSRAALASVTTLKGFTYEEAVASVMRDIACGLGDEYNETGTHTGRLSHCKKGDGVLTLHGGTANLVLEMSDSVRTTWNDYLEEAERNRGAIASLGLVPTVQRNEGQTIRALGARRVVMAFDPQEDDPAMLRTVVMLLRTAAMVASGRVDDADMETASERVAEALAVLPKMDIIRKAAGSIRKNADRVDTEADKMQTVLNRLLLQAQTALRLTVIDSGSGATVAAVEQSTGAA